MLVHFLHHEADTPFVAAVEPLLSSRDMERHPTVDGSDVVVVLASASALRDGLGERPAAALRSGVPLLPVILDDATVPRPYPAARKHMAIASDPASLVRLLEDHRKNAGAKIADGKRELFGYGVLLALIAR